MFLSVCLQYTGGKKMHKLYLDMDGVLADFNRGVKNSVI